MATFDLTGQRVLVTGALGGIGQVACQLLQSMGAVVTALDTLTDSEATERLDSQGLSDIRYMRLDLTDGEQLSVLEASLPDLQPTALVSLAGVVHSGDLHTQSYDDIRRVIETNVTGQAALAAGLVRHWLKQRHAGNMVFTSSWVSHVPWPSITPYAASKAAVVALARGVAREYATHGIRANVISPGIVDVGMAARQWREEPDYRARASRAIPLGRLQLPQEVAGGIAFLLSDWASYMTGAVLEMDGGASLYPLDPGEVATL